MVDDPGDLEVFWGVLLSELWVVARRHRLMAGSLVRALEVVATRVW